MKIHPRPILRLTFLRLLCLCAILPSLPSLRAADDKLLAAVRAADDERVAATKAGDRARLEAIYSNDLHYAHSSGKVDTKTSYIDSLVKRSTVYENFQYQTREFQPAAPGIVLMTGRVLVDVRSANGKQQLDLNFLSVWREENGKWRFLAWQSCKNPPPADMKK